MLSVERPEREPRRVSPRTLSAPWRQGRYITAGPSTTWKHRAPCSKSREKLLPLFHSHSLQLSPWFYICFLMPRSLGYGGYLWGECGPHRHRGPHPATLLSTPTSHCLCSAPPTPAGRVTAVRVGGGGWALIPRCGEGAERGHSKPQHMFPCPLPNTSSKIKMITNFKLVTAEIKSQAQGPLLSPGPFVTVPVEHL